jgi:hypothetical protein
LQRRNSLRRERVNKELAVLRPLPARPPEDYSVELVKVTRTITVRRNLYSVPSQLIGERVEVRIFAEQLQVWFGGNCVATMARLRGQGQQAINYRHVIHSLVRKPGAFAHTAINSVCFRGFANAVLSKVLAARPTLRGINFLQLTLFLRRDFGKNPLSYQTTVLIEMFGCPCCREQSSSLANAENYEGRESVNAMSTHK